MSETLHRVFLRTYNEVDALLRRRLSADARVSHAKLIEQASRDDAVIAEVGRSCTRSAMPLDRMIAAP